MLRLWTRRKSYVLPTQLYLRGCGRPTDLPFLMFDHYRVVYAGSPVASGDTWFLICCAYKSLDALDVMKDIPLFRVHIFQEMRTILRHDARSSILFPRSKK